MKRRKSQIRSKVPVIGFTELRHMVDGGMRMGHTEMLDIWYSLLRTADAVEPPALYGFVAALLQVRDDLFWEKRTVDWQELPGLALNRATPANLEVCVIL